MTYWVTLKQPIRYRGADRQAFSVDGETEADAIANAHTHFALAGCKVDDVQILSVQTLPYPAEPRLGYKSGDCPSFCMRPHECAGRSSCPRSIACSE